MTSTLPGWLMKRYAKLMMQIGKREFSFNEAKEILNDKNASLNVILSELKKR